PYVNKGDCGRAFILAGSTGFAGAALLSAKAALRSGAGYVHLLHRPEMAAVYDAKIPEVLTLLVPCLPGSHLPDLEALAEQLSKAAAILIGPGFGLDTWALRILEHCLKEVDIPLIVDADGLALISKHPYLCKHLARKNVLLTPHQGEFQRLCGIDRYTFDQDPLAHLTAFVNKHSAKVLLKSYTTVYCDPHHTFYNTRGNDGLATGGSGDTLAGIICSFAAQGMPLPLAAINAAYLMGKTAEQLSRRRGTPSILPSDVIESLFVW
ncbi:MAG: NAD(P)H-hydrate dehydratase, partial [Candidatus Cloacimonadaceae bacterium]|nr:NAD(P)H-hydrate dehydratase [Candidatus Cloacimonadaceae bacterium]